jgi:hypothetical protein
MSRRLGAHRQRPARSEANRARAEIDAARRQLAAYQRAGDVKNVAETETKIAWLVVNSLCR